MILWNCSGVILNTTRFLGPYVYVISVTDYVMVSGCTRILCIDGNTTLRIVKLHVDSYSVVYDKQLLLPIDRAKVGIVTVSYPMIDDEGQLVIVETSVKTSHKIISVDCQYELYVIDIDAEPLVTLSHHILIVPGFSKPIDTWIESRDNILLFIESLMCPSVRMELQVSLCWINYREKKIVRTTKSVMLMEPSRIISYGLEDKLWLSLIGTSGNLHFVSEDKSYYVPLSSIVPIDYKSFNCYNYLIVKSNEDTVVTVHFDKIPICYVQIKDFVGRNIIVGQSRQQALIVSDTHIILVSYAPCTLFETVFRYMIETGIDFDEGVRKVPKINNRLIASGID